MALEERLGSVCFESGLLFRDLGGNISHGSFESSEVAIMLSSKYHSREIVV